jgi:DsbC/DsbD-like thiol-disulfide interchange protein
VTLSADVSWLVCSNVCIPAKTTVSVDLPVQRGAPHQDAQTIDLFRLRGMISPSLCPPAGA